MNDKLQHAYEQLGLSADITREELDSRFDLLLKRQRSNSSEGNTTYEEDFQAFKFILDTLDKQEIQEKEEQRLAKWGILSGVARKSENFIRLYKVHTIISVIVVILLVVGGNALYNNLEERKYLASLPPLDATIMFLGNYESQDSSGKTNNLNEMIVADYPEWKRVETTIVQLPTSGGADGTLEMSYLQRAIAMLAADKPDILIMDEAAFNWIKQQEGLQNLESIISTSSLTPDDMRLKRATLESGQEEVIGLDISNTSFASDLPIRYGAPSFIAGILASDDMKDKAMEFVEHIIKEEDTQ
ncbi:hypothetical protein ACP8HI_13195 [Paenibacillus sp. FA6]|uniref:hypothetical protein n=1 Tax=Paenibacillus sp. FA6 TaxID=3413029 RepID=UPI003F65513D